MAPLPKELALSTQGHSDATGSLAHIPKHLHQRRQCGICSFLFCPGDSVVALISPGSSTHCLTLICPKFQDFAYARPFKAWSFCQLPFCAICKDAPEAASFHADCYKLYIHYATSPQKKHRLWRLACWAHPWPECPFLQLSPEPRLERATRVAADVYKLKPLAVLPLEILSMIWDFCSPSILLRFGAVMDVADRLDAADDVLVSMPLSRVGFWKRGNRLPSPTTFNNEKLDLLVTIDSSGIQKVERAEPPCGFTASQRKDLVLYTVCKSGQDIDVSFALGLCRFSLRNTRLQVWDIPFNFAIPCGTPIPSRLDLPAARIGTVAFSKCTGITFFITHGKTRAIHVHTPAMPLAEPTFRLLWPSARAVVTWVYLPLPRVDTVLAFGLRHGICDEDPVSGKYSYFIRTSLLGDFSAGPFWKHGTYTFGYPVFRRSVLLHTVSRSHPVLILGTHPPGKRPPWFTPMAPNSSPLSEDACYSSAVLKDVACVWVFRDPQTEFLRGLLLDYQHGAQRALGECKLGLDSVEKVYSLSDLAFSSFRWLDNKTLRKAVRAKVSSSLSASLSWMWTRCAEGKVLEVWVTHNELVVSQSRNM